MSVRALACFVGEHAARILLCFLLRHCYASLPFPSPGCQRHFFCPASLFGWHNFRFFSSFPLVATRPNGLVNPIKSVSGAFPSSLVALWLLSALFIKGSTTGQLPNEICSSEKSAMQVRMSSRRTTSTGAFAPGHYGNMNWCTALSLLCSMPMSSFLKCVPCLLTHFLRTPKATIQSTSASSTVLESVTWHRNIHKYPYRSSLMINTYCSLVLPLAI